MFLNQECTRDLDRTGQNRINFTFHLPAPERRVLEPTHFSEQFLLNQGLQNYLSVPQQQGLNTASPQHSLLQEGVISGQFRSERVSINAACSYTGLPITLCLNPRTKAALEEEDLSLNPCLQHSGSSPAG